MVYGYGRGLARRFGAGIISGPGRGGGAGFGFRGTSPASPYIGRGRGGLPRCADPGLRSMPNSGRFFTSTGENISEASPASVEDTGLLKEQADILKKQLEDIERRILDIENKEK